MNGLYYLAAMTALFIFLFFREDRLEHKKAVRRDIEGDLHVLREMKKYCDEKGKDSSLFERSIQELIEKLK